METLIKIVLLILIIGLVGGSETDKSLDFMNLYIALILSFILEFYEKIKSFLK